MSKNIIPEIVYFFLLFHMNLTPNLIKKYLNVKLISFSIF